MYAKDRTKYNNNKMSPVTVKAKVVCDETKMTVEVEKSSVTGIDEDHLRLNDPSNSACDLQRFSNNTHIIGVIPLNACGTQIEVRPPRCQILQWDDTCTVFLFVCDPFTPGCLSAFSILNLVRGDIHPKAPARLTDLELVSSEKRSRCSVLVRGGFMLPVGRSALRTVSHQKRNQHLVDVCKVQCWQCPQM